MNREERLNEALKGLRESVAGRTAPAFQETRLRALFREHHASRRRRFHVTLAATLAIASVAAFFFIRPEPVQQDPVPPTVLSREREAATVQSQPLAEALATKPTVVEPSPPRKRRRPRPAATEAPTELAVAATSFEDFLPLPYAPPMLQEEAGQVIRVRVPRQSLRSLGLPVNEERVFERVPADLLLGEDGVPRAIRFVNATGVSAYR